MDEQRAYLIPEGWMLVPKHRGTQPLADLIQMASLACVESRLLDHDDRRELAQYADLLRDAPCANWQSENQLEPVAQWQYKLLEPLLPECDVWLNIGEEGAKTTREKYSHVYKVRALYEHPVPQVASGQKLTDLHKELGQLRWMGADEGWDRAIEAVRKRIAELNLAGDSGIDWRGMLAILIEIYDDALNNSPDDRVFPRALWGQQINEARSLLADPSTGSTNSLTDAARDVLAERERQVTAEGWTPEHDSKYRDNELPRAAACYALAFDIRFSDLHVWPWERSWWKPTDKRRNLVKAAALILAEIERLDRVTATEPQP